jgi:hypothetical protein
MASVPGCGLVSDAAICGDRPLTRPGQRLIQLLLNGLCGLGPFTVRVATTSGPEVTALILVTCYPGASSTAGTLRDHQLGSCPLTSRARRRRHRVLHPVPPVILVVLLG